MVNVPPTTPLSSSGNAAPAAPATNVTPVEATVTTTPDKIQDLLRQIQITGTLASAPDAGTITLNTAMGELSLALPQMAEGLKQKLVDQLLGLFQNQRPLTVVVQPGNPPTQAFLLMPQTSPVLTAPVPSVQASTAAMPLAQPLTPGALISAFILPQNIAAGVATEGSQVETALVTSLISSFVPSASVPSASGAAYLQQLGGLPLLTNAANVDVKAGVAPLPVEKADATVDGLPAKNANQGPLSSPPNLQTNLPGVPAPGTSPVPQSLIPAGQTNAPISLTSLLQPGNAVTLRVDMILPPGSPLPPLTSPNQLVATVVGTGPSGQLLLKTDDATFFIKQPSSLPAGTVLLVSVEAAKSGASASLPYADTIDLPVLQQTLGALAQLNPQLMQQLLDVMPQATAALPGALLFFLSAFKQGNLRGWSGDNVIDALTRAGKLDLIEKLTQEFREAGQPAHDAVVGEWRSYPIPLHNQNQFHVLNLYVHDDGQKQSQGAAHAAPGKVRFLIDMRMSRLGLMQLDGLVQSKKLDMIVRSETVLPSGLPQELRDVYSRTLDGLGYSGGLGFQTGRQNWLAIRKDAAQSALLM